jgi:hypothetical protein
VIVPLVIDTVMSCGSPNVASANTLAASVSALVLALLLQVNVTVPRLMIPVRPSALTPVIRTLLVSKAGLHTPSCAGAQLSTVTFEGS